MNILRTYDLRLPTKHLPRLFARHLVRQRTTLAVGFAKFTIRIAFTLVIATLLYSAVKSAAAESSNVKRLQSLSSIRSTAEEYVHTNSELNAPSTSTLIVTAGDLDARLQLEQCATPLSIFTLNAAPIAARTTIGVRCAPVTGTASADWTVYVPVTIESELDVLVLRKSMPRDAHLAAEDFDTQRRRVPGLSTAYISNAAALRDQHLKRPTPAGTTLTTDLLARDLVVKRGQQVVLVFATGGLAIQAPGLALADGGTADRIRVQNQTSLKIVEGVVESGNLVRVGM
jgi:flagellar basal body P-ring formation protein FlgA